MIRVELLSGLLRLRRAIVLGALATVTAAAWAYLLLGGGIEMEMMDMGGGHMMAMLPAWSPTYALAISVIWLMWGIACSQITGLTHSTQTLRPSFWQMVFVFGDKIIHSPVWMLFLPL